MLKVSIYIQDRITSEYNRVDLFDDEKISVTSSIQNINDLSKTYTDFSQTFVVPASSNNNSIFKHWYDNTNDDPFSTLTKSNAFIEIDSISFRKGKIQLENANVVNGHPQDYSITFIGVLGNLKDTFNGLYLSDLTSDKTYDFAYSATSIKDKVTTTATSADVMFPLISSKNRWTWNDNGAFDIKVNSHPIRYNELFPAIKLRSVLNMIETQFGINFDGTTEEPSTFLTGDNRFTNAYLWLKNKDTIDNFFTFSKIDFTTKGTLEQSLGVSVNLTNNTFIAPNSYNTITITPSAGYTTVPYILKRYLGSTNVTTTTKSAGGTATNDYLVFGDSRNQSFQIQSSQPLVFTAKIDVRFYYSPLTFTATMGTQTTGSLFSIANSFPNIKIEDFFSGLLKMFNMTCYSNDGINYTIEQLENYYNAGADVDITKYVLQDKNNINRVKTYKKINFEYENSDSFVNVAFKSENSIGYGDLYYSSTPQTDGDDYSIKLPFENLNFINLVDELQVGFALNIDSNKYIPKPIILYDYNPTALTDLGTNNYHFSTSTTLNGTSYTKYKAFGQETIIGANTYSLNFPSQESTISNLMINKGLYNQYYENYLSNMFNFKARLVKVSAILPTNILTSLKLKDNIIIRDAKYIVNTMTTDLTTGEVQFELLTDQRI